MTAGFNVIGTSVNTPTTGSPYCSAGEVCERPCADAGFIHIAVFMQGIMALSVETTPRVCLANLDHIVTAQEQGLLSPHARRCMHRPHTVQLALAQQAARLPQHVAAWMQPVAQQGTHASVA